MDLNHFYQNYKKKIGIKQDIRILIVWLPKQETFNLKVIGSNPIGRTYYIRLYKSEKIMKITIKQLIDLLSKEDSNTIIRFDIYPCGYCIEGWMKEVEKEFKKWRHNPE